MNATAQRTAHQITEAGHKTGERLADVGEAIAAQLASALQSTGCFVVTDRMALSDILREQELGLAGIVNPETAKQPVRERGRHREA